MNIKIKGNEIQVGDTFQQGTKIVTVKSIKKAYKTTTTVVLTNGTLCGIRHSASLVVTR